MPIHPYEPSAVNGPFFARDPLPTDDAFPHGYRWIAVVGNAVREWACFDSTNKGAAEWLKLSEAPKEVAGE